MQFRRGTTFSLKTLGQQTKPYHAASSFYQWASTHPNHIGSANSSLSLHHVRHLPSLQVSKHRHFVSSFRLSALKSISRPSSTSSTSLITSSMSTAAVARPSHLAHLASVDLSNYDPEQSRLMDERCILVNEDDRAWGAADKKTCHLMENIDKGLLHRAFSAFVFRPSDGKLLLQQRASEKITFPDMWTNTCCSHPLDDFAEEKIEQNQQGIKHAASRKLEHELGIPKLETPIDQFEYLTRIHYLAPSTGLWGEHEIDYILFITADVTVTPNLNEIRDYKYVSKEELSAMFNDPKNSFTPWFRLIARDFLFGWWDELLARRSSPSEPVQASKLRGIADGSKIFRMV